MELNQLTYFERESDIDSLYKAIKNSDIFTMVDTAYEKDGFKDNRTILFHNNRVLFVSSNHQILGIKSAGKGVSVFLPPSRAHELADIRLLRLTTIDGLRYSNIYGTIFTKPARLFRVLKEIDKIRGENTVLEWFFKKYKNELETVMKDSKEFK
jgi:hypothetical protein